MEDYRHPANAINSIDASQYHTSPPIKDTTQTSLFNYPATQATAMENEIDYGDDVEVTEPSYLNGYYKKMKGTIQQIAGIILQDGDLEGEGEQSQINGEKEIEAVSKRQSCTT
ncbi:hypothetical protein PHYBLDRAFT_153307 [Phycomyces blakesleeanus NRRL 1555(-)]|uniref:Uncharacterized protein n=1 Tax=Phycomyces blakesleeanus (strain ATCC 8743b / DSM 1359 / FGSC 10004 / NBRC 33097 / NRRL 1555) TaxID=763407 RepID=A0A167JAS0_PHYB8|nr:hypothetical protein PHYBLDRAFT_153307 [Phycomyces blakesleeanus NRRL 1555(-)]OAD65618.1 hypothetical protein PHYBLDRAFT_153307 [Phycomyces blakesleeanus NRRL 1555(-)]|eukprot:XP_018283658.1 hypothetical protein PHYBLDRAFT_153307 [Phycomyces blakesleeanus NRRL 1555(-)]